MTVYVIVGARPVEGVDYQFWSKPQRAWTTRREQASEFPLRSNAERAAQELRDSGSFEPVRAVQKQLVDALLKGHTRGPSVLEQEGSS